MSEQVRQQEHGRGAPPRRRRSRRATTERAPLNAGAAGGRYRPLGDADIGRIDDAARALLARVGLSGAPPTVIELARRRGAGLTDDGRLTFPPPLVEQALAGPRRGFTLHGRGEGHELPLDGTRVHPGSGGAAPSVVDMDTGRYRDSTLADLHDAARLVDALANVRFFSRSLVARDLEEERALDINTAYASLAGTAKHVMTSVGGAAHVADIAEICALVAGSAEAFAARPFLSLNINHVAPPLRFAPEACEVLVAAARAGLPVQVNTFGQLGASSPVTIAGSLAQTMAETLAGMIVAWLAEPGVRAVFGPRPMVTDLRTGAMSGGGGEQALLMAAAVQMARAYGLPNSCIAGATDSKLADAQSGYEKALSVTLAAQAGADLVTQSCGMQAGLMGVAFESYVIDNDMLGAILRSAGEIEVGDATLSVDEIGRVARGEGHFLGQPQTLERMQSDFLYPDLADRRSPAEWAAAGAPDIRERARARAREILSDAPPAAAPRRGRPGDPGAVRHPPAGRPGGRAVKIAVIGAGAMGSVYAALLAEAGHEVWAVDLWPEHVAAISQRGLRVEGASGDRTVRGIRAATDPAEAGACDLYVIATKAAGVAAAARAIAPLMAPDSLVLTIQNGLGAGERIAEHLPADGVLLGVAEGFGASMRGPGHVHHNAMRLIRIGEMRGGLTERLERLAALWREAGFEVATFADIDQLIWEKFLCNVTFSAPCTVFGCKVGELMATPEWWAIALGCAGEAHAAGQARGVRFSFDDPVTYVTAFGAAISQARPSMLLDHMAGRRSEIDAINGMVPVVAAEHGLPAPYNETLAAIVRAREAAFAPPRSG